MTAKQMSGESWSSCVHGRPPCAQATCVVGVFPGEGIGPEVVQAALTVLEAAAAAEGFGLKVRQGGRIGCEAEASEGAALPAEAVAFCRSVFAEGGAVLHGAGGGRFVYDLRARFDLFCKISPVRAFPELHGCNRMKSEHSEGVDILFVRENAGGIYQGVSRRLQDGRGLVIEHSFSYAEAQVRRIAGVAARLARTRTGDLAVVVKEGGLSELSLLWRECAVAAAEDEGVHARFLNVDHAAYEILQNPRLFDVVLTPNLFGDVLVDLSAVLTGSRGLSFSGNFADSAAVYQTNHGAAHDLAGTDTANPVGQILSAAMMLRESFGQVGAADRIVRAAREFWRRGWRTPDLAEGVGRLAGTREAGELIADIVLSAG